MEAQAIRWMNGVMAVVGAILVGACVFRWRWMVEGRKFRALASIHPWLPIGLYGVMGSILLVLGGLGAAGIWRGGLDFRWP